MTKTNLISEEVKAEFKNELLGFAIEDCETLDDVNWNKVTTHLNNISDNFIRRYAKYINWDWAVKRCKLSSDVIVHLTCVEALLQTSDVIEYQELDQSAIEQLVPYFTRNDWYILPAKQKLSNEFLLTKYWKMDMRSIFKYQTISEEFIRKVYNIIDDNTGDLKMDKMCWAAASYRGEFTKGFIWEFRKQLNLKYLLRNNKINNSVLISIYGSFRCAREAAKEWN